MLLLGHGLAVAGGAGNGSQVSTASMLTILRLNNLTVALAVSSARVTGHGASRNMFGKLRADLLNSTASNEAKDIPYVHTFLV